MKFWLRFITFLAQNLKDDISICLIICYKHQHLQLHFKRVSLITLFDHKNILLRPAMFAYFFIFRTATNRVRLAYACAYVHAISSINICNVREFEIARLQNWACRCKCMACRNVHRMKYMYLRNNEFLAIRHFIIIIQYIKFGKAIRNSYIQKGENVDCLSLSTK